MRANRKTGFTLLEMLMVVSIMVLLLGMVGISVGAAVERARKSKAQAETAELIRAWKSYWKTYNKWPSTFPKDGDGVVQNLEMEKKWMDILSGTDINENPKKLKFIDLASSEKGMLDPWGNRYMVYFNSTDISGVEYFQTSVCFPATKRYIYEREQ